MTSQLFVGTKASVELITEDIAAHICGWRGYRPSSHDRELGAVNILRSVVNLIGNPVSQAVKKGSWLLPGLLEGLGRGSPVVRFL